jgi:hypothetical protein
MPKRITRKRSDEVVAEIRAKTTQQDETSAAESVMKR